MESLEKKFADITKITDNYIKCPNQFVAIISIEKNKICFLENYINKKKRQNDEFKRFNIHMHDKCEINKTIVMILESPYKNEYNEKGNAIGPACGKTGENISKYLLSNLMKYRLFEDELSNGCYLKSTNEISEGVYKLFLVNVVPFQCKKSSDKSKNELINACMNNLNFQKYLISEIKAHTPTIIINSVTQGIYKERINEILLENFSSRILLKSYHPSSALFTSGFSKI